MNGGKTKSKIVKMMAMLLCTMLITGSTAALWGSYATVSAEENFAKTLKLAKTEGTVQVTDSIGKKLPSFEQMTLKNGQHVKTDVASYAWINMDDSKTAKVGQKSDVDISQQKEDLEIRLNSGDVLVNVTKKIAKTATVKIRTGTTVTGITGTTPLARVRSNNDVTISMLDGIGNLAMTNSAWGETRTLTLRAGQSADISTIQSADGRSTTTVSIRQTRAEDFTTSAIQEIAADSDFAQKIQNANPGVDIPGLIANADNLATVEEQNVKQQDDQIASGLQSDQRTVNNSVQQTKDDDNKAAEEANKKHSDDDDEDEDTACEHEWSFNLVPNNLDSISSVILLYVIDHNQSLDSDPIAVQLTGNNDDPVLRGSAEALAKCGKCGTSQTFTVQISVDLQSRRYTFSNTQCGYSTTGLVSG